MPPSSIELTMLLVRLVSVKDQGRLKNVNHFTIESIIVGYRTVNELMDVLAEPTQITSSLLYVSSLLEIDTLPE